MANLRKSWDTIAKHCADRYDISKEVVNYGPLCPGEDKLGLLGDTRGKKDLDLGCGCGQNAIALHRMGASVTGVDFSRGQLEQADILAGREEVTVDFLCADVGDISMLPDAHFDLVLSACTLAFEENGDQILGGAY